MVLHVQCSAICLVIRSKQELFIVRLLLHQHQFSISMNKLCEMTREL